MKRANFISRIASLRLTALMLVLILGTVAVPQNTLIAGISSEEEAVSKVTGTFDGLDLKGRKIWISDMVYLLDVSVSVKGTSRKLGLITELEQGEIIKAYLRENEDNPHIPYVTRIERQ